MFPRSRRRYAPVDVQPSREPSFRPRWPWLATGVSRMVVVTLITFLLISSNTAIRPALAAEPPIGYERWTGPDVDSGVDFGLTAEQVFQKYAATFHLGGLPQVEPQKERRLIDIEIHAGRGGLAHYLYDVVWVENESDFALDSWLVPGMEEAELAMLPGLAPHGIVAVDLERFPKGDEWRYSVILQRNSGAFGWELLTDVSLDEVLDAAERRGLRVLDLDYAAAGPLSCPTDRGQACSEATFDAILVANSGGNAIQTKIWANMSPAQIAAKQDQGYQIIDREIVADGTVTVWVRPGLPFDLHDGLTQHEVIFQNGHHGRVVDLEHGSASYALVHLAASAAPGSPGLAPTRPNGARDRQPQARDRDRKARGKTDRDRKAQAKKAGKRGKGKKGGRR